MSRPQQAPAGPRRLILIHSGKYDYAEIDLAQPFQLVGVNGLGKTALISTLQYLYLDNQNDMRFGQHSTDESRKFYFRSEASFILFECESSLGTMTIGVRGQGPTRNYELERFAWRGSYSREDFIAPDGRPFTWAAVRQNLSAKDLRVFQDNREFRLCLGTEVEDASVSLGLVPLSDVRDYPRFRKTFQRLLHLKDIRQDDLKELLADCARLGPSERMIDLEDEFRKELGRIVQQRDEILRLEAASPAVSGVRQLHESELRERSIAHAVVRELQERHANYASWFRSQVEALSKTKEGLEGSASRLSGELTSLQSQVKEAASKQGVAEAALTLLRRKREEFHGYCSDLESQGLQQLHDEIVSLEAQLKDAPAEPLEVLLRQQDQKTAELKAKRDALDRVDALLIAWMRSHLPEQQVTRLGALFDPKLLLSIVDEQAFIRDEVLLTERLSAIASACDAHGYSDEALLLKFAPGALSAVQRAGRTDDLQESIGDLTRQLSRLSKNIEVAENAAPLQTRLAQAKAEHKEKGLRLHEYDQFLKEEGKAETYEQEFASCQRRLSELEGLMARAQREAAEVQRQQDQVIVRFDELQRNNSEILREARNMPVADGDDPGPSELAAAYLRDLPEDILAVFKDARARCFGARALMQSLENKMALLDREFQGSSFRYDPAAPLENRLQVLEAEIVALPERREHVERLWKTVLVSARSGFKTILTSLGKIKKQVRNLNSELAGIEFSSISDVKLEVVENQTALADYQRHSEDAMQPSLFDAAEDSTRLMDRFTNLLKSRPKLLLNELFSLRCLVTRKDGTRNSYDDFDNIESTGTTIVLKVTLNLLVLRDLLISGKARIPFYLDEVHALDRQNFGNILQLSERLGFIGIYAAPTSAIGPRCFVHLIPDARGRLVVNSAHRKEILRLPPEPPPASP